MQILTLDDAEADKRQTFRREGSAEILELEHDQGSKGEQVEEEAEELELNRLPRQRQALEVLQEEEVEEDASSSSPAGMPPHNSNLGQYQQNSSRASTETEILRKISDHKEQQTDITYALVNKKVQADTMTSEDQNSDIDDHEMDEAEVSSSVLSQSIR